jgi:hypothetical protein
MMKLGLFGAAFVITLMLDFCIATCTAGQNVQDEKTTADLTKLRNYIEEIMPGKKWQTGPTRIDSDEIRKAFEKQRFYYVFSSPPMPPGAPLQELLEEYKEKLEAHQKQFISLTMSIGEEGKVTPLHDEEDYNLGMMRVTTDEDAKICAAAILSMYSSDPRVGPGIVSAKEITVTRSESGWSCSMLRENAFQGTVVFDSDGKVVSATKTYMGPLPS